MQPAYRFRMIRSISALVFVFAVLTACGQKKIIIPANFIETPKPRTLGLEWQALNQSENEFKVENIEWNLKVSEDTGTTNTMLDISGGTLVGINKGEFGGLLKFVPDEKLQEDILIKKGNIKFIFKFKDRIYFIEGLAHMGYRGGALFRLEIQNNGFTWSKLIDFNDAPEAFTIYQNNFLIAAHQSFYIVEDLKKKLIVNNAFWRSLYPNSIAAFNDHNIFIGIRGGIIKLDLTTKAVRFFRYSK